MGANPAGDARFGRAEVRVGREDERIRGDEVHGGGDRTRGCAEYGRICRVQVEIAPERDSYRLTDGLIGADRMREGPAQGCDRADDLGIRTERGREAVADERVTTI